MKVDGEGSPQSETFANPDGSLTTEAYAQPSFRRAGTARDGRSWLPLTAALSGTGSPADPFVADGLPRKVTVGRAAKDLLSVDVPGGAVSLSAEGLRLRAPTRTGSTVSFADAATDTDLQLVVGTNGVKTNLVLRSAAAPRSFRFHLSDPRGLLGGVREMPDGSFQFDRDLGDGWRLGLAPATAYAPAELDPKSGPGVDRGSASQTMVRAGDGWDVTLAVNPGWLAGRAFPVVLDPSPVFVAGTFGVMDCHLVNGSYATTNFCGSASAVRDAGTWSSLVRRTLLRFGLTSIPTTAVVSAATLDMTLSQVLGASTPMGVRAYRVTSGWLNSATWNSNGAVAWSGGNYDSSVLLASTQVGLATGHYTWAVSPAAVQAWVNGSVSNYGLLLRTVDESVTGAFRFASGAATDPATRPRLTITYTVPPVRPAGLRVQPCAVQCATPVLTSSLAPTLTAQSSDLDSGILRYDFEVWAGSSSTPTTMLASGSVPNAAPGTPVQWKVPAGIVTATGTYEYRVRAHDGALFSPWSEWTVFYADPYPPAVPTVDSPDWTNGGWGGPTAGVIQFFADSSAVGYSTQLDEQEWTDFEPETTRWLSGLTEGRHTFSVRAQDQAGNVSPTLTWTIGVNVGGIDSPAVEARTAARVTAAASAQTGRDWLTWKYRLGSTGGFTTVPLTNMTVPGTSTNPAAWPVQRSGGVLPPLVWDVATTAGADGLVQLQACLGTSASDPAPVCTAGRNIQLSRAGGAYATTPAGPGSVSLLTGDMSVSESDVDVPSYTGSLSIGRTLTTLSPSTVTTGAAGVFGPAWTASLPGPDAGAADVTVLDKSANGYLALVGEDGTQDIYDRSSASGTTTTYVGIGEAGTDGATLVKDTAPTPDTLTLTELDGTRTVWSLSGSTWGITSVTEAGAAGTATTTYTRDGSGRVTQILAPVPAGVSCTSPLSTAGCRTLTLTYATTTTATGTAPAQWGSYTGRLSTVAFTAYDPATSAMATVQVAAYAYDSTGMLRAAWDPRITPELKTTYSYDAANRLTSITPPGLSAWSLGYDGTNRLTTVTRPDPGGGTQTTTVRYGVPFTGAGAPVELGGTETAKWGQSDLPTTATAVWGPERVPAATPTATDWQYADLSYLDVNGRAVNTAAWGANAWQVSTTEYDKRGNTVRTLSAGNRNDALTPAANPHLDPYVAAQPTSAARADLLSQVTVYSADGVDELESVGPMHPVVLDDGTTAPAREHTTTTYDQGAPTAGYRLPTTSVTAAQTPDGVDKDPRTTLTGYAPLVAGDPSGWDLRQATTTTTDMPGATPDIVKKTRYNSAGQTIETRMPSDPTGVGAGTSRTTYYTAAGAAPCGGKPHWAGLTCQTFPAAQPGTGPALPVTTTTYTLWDAPATVTEVAGTTTRTTTTTFDGAGRSTGQSVTVTPSGAGGTDIPAVTTGYSATTGLPTTTTTSAGVITVGYDAVGQATSYTQTSGGTTITTATRTYDIAGRVATVTDGKGTTTYTYDSATDHRGNTLTAADTLAGTVSATYDADGGTDTVSYPGGLTATTVEDNAGNDTRLTYAKAGTTWLTFTQTESVHGQVRTAAGPAGRQLNTYDAAARLTRVDDLSATATACTRRDYAFDANTNRTGLTTTPGSGLVAPTGTALCDLTGATPVTVASTYDTADRATGTGYTYDTLARTTALPASAVTGGSPLTVGYATNDMVATLTQAGRTKTYTLDPTRRIPTTADTAGPTLTNHYTAGDDNPAWIDSSDGTWTRYLDAPSGGLALTVDNTGTVVLNLANLHGDIVATAAPTDTGPATYSETTEYGLARDPAAPGRRYGWLGSHHRNTGDTLAQITLMGVRLYNPTTGRFLSVDPVAGGSCNDYDYVCADPINALDLDGRWRTWIKRNWRSVVKNAVGAASLFCYYCGVVSAIVYSGPSLYRNLRQGNWRGAMWDAASIASAGYATRLRYAAGGARKASQYWSGKMANSRTRTGSTYRRYKARRDQARSTIARSQRRGRALRYADYGHWSASAAYDTRRMN